MPDKLGLINVLSRSNLNIVDKRCQPRNCTFDFFLQMSVNFQAILQTNVRKTENLIVTFLAGLFPQM